MEQIPGESIKVTLTENEIRPQVLMAEQAARFANDIRRLNGRKDEFVEVPCPACGADEAQKRFEKYGLDYVDCQSCGTMYVTPRPTPEILAWYYATSENYQYWSKHIFPASEDSRRAKIFRPRAERLADICRRHAVPTGTLMEVGAGFGTFGEEIKALGLFGAYVAVEPTPDLAEICRRKGLDVIELPIEQVDVRAMPVDVVASFEVIEHLFAPSAFIERCTQALSPGGLLVLSCPNGKGFEVQVLQQESDTVDVEHLNYFNPRSLTELVRSHGLEVIETSTPGELDAELVRKKVLAGGINLSGQPFLTQLLLEEWETAGAPFQAFLAANGLSSHMWLVARKPGNGNQTG